MAPRRYFLYKHPIPSSRNHLYRRLARYPDKDRMLTREKPSKERKTARPPFMNNSTSTTTTGRGIKI